MWLESPIEKYYQLKFERKREIGNRRAAIFLHLIIRLLFEVYQKQLNSLGKNKNSLNDIEILKIRCHFTEVIYCGASRCSLLIGIVF